MKEPPKFDVSLPDESPPPTATCNARKQDGSLCPRPAGENTSHYGVGRCRAHGGDGVLVKHLPDGRRRYAVITSGRIAELITHFNEERDGDRLDLSAEIDALRAIFVDLIERYHDITEALLNWSASYQLTRKPLPRDVIERFRTGLEAWRCDVMALNSNVLTKDDAEHLEQARQYLYILEQGPDVNRPRQVIDIADAYKILESIGKMVERVEKVRSNNAVSRPELNRIMQEMFRSVDTRVRDDGIKQQIIDDWMRIKA